MRPVRPQTPIRRSITRVVKTWGDHKSDLKIDFDSHCAYCGSFDGYRNTYYEVDHFVPKSFFEPLGNIGLTQYDNLVYSCRFCNRNKWDKWPSQSETIYSINNEGFVDPCTPDYDKHLYRTRDGAIMWITPLGKWMHSTAFKFDERERGIKLLWNLNRLRLVMKRLISIRNNYEEESKEYISINEKLKEYSLKYTEFDFELIDYYDE